jgi:hypothetical protein
VQLPAVGQGLLIHERCKSYSATHYSRQDSTGRVISSSQRTLPDNKQHTQQADIHFSVGFESTISADEPPPTHALNRTVTANNIWLRNELIRFLNCRVIGDKDCISG